MFCPKCGKELKEGAKFCASCGAQIGAASTSGGAPGGDAATLKAESAVNAPAAADPKAKNTAGAPTVPAPAKKRKKPIALAAAGVAAVAVVAVVAVGLLATNVISPSYGIDEEHFPDSAFRSYVSAKFDADGDGKLSTEEVEAVEYMGTWNAEDFTYDGGLDDLGISDLSGIEIFTNLKGISASGNSFTDVDLSSNGALEYVVMDCDSLNHLKVPGSSGLQAVHVQPQTEVEGLDGSMVKNTLLKTYTSESDSTYTFSYDTAGHMVSSGSRDFYWEGDKIVGVDGNDFYSLTYDEDGRLEEADGKRYFYDDQGKVSAVLNGAYCYLYSYDDAGNLTSVSKELYNNSKTRSYELADVDRSKAEVVLTIAYNDDGLPISIAKGNTTYTFEYDASGNVSAMGEKQGVGPTITCNFSYDDNGRLVSCVGDRTDCFYYTYNEKGQIASSADSDLGVYNPLASYENEYTYDDFGNLLTASHPSRLDSGTVTLTHLDVYVPREIESYGAISGMVSYAFYGTDIPKVKSGTFTSVPVPFSEDYIDIMFDAPQDVVEFVTGQALPFAEDL